ncbi:unnamed protein product [Closterium sp. Naga37s-1]|nr:unnamed protein product [Closterium sp. Naga37s-1]
MCDRFQDCCRVNRRRIRGALEKQYALEMWRLLDPEGKLIQPKELSACIISVKAGTFKSLQKVFHRNDCDPRMAVIIDDRMNVWEERDQPRVHLVQPFAPYAAPLAEVNLAVPVLAVSGESVRIQDESPAISPPGFGPPGFTTLGSRAQTRDPPLVSSPSKKAVPASMKRNDSELEASTRETIALNVSNDMNSMQGAAKRRRLIGPS